MLMYIISKAIKKLHISAIRKSSIHRTSKVEAGSTIINTNFGKYSFCGYFCTIIDTDIGNFTSIADNVRIGGAKHPYEWGSTSPVFYSGRDSVKEKFAEFDRPKEPETHIGNDVWIGANVLIKAGVKVGNGAVVGMGSVVTKDVEPYAIVAGNPAKFIKFRFDEQTRYALAATQWWMFNTHKLRKLGPHVKDPISFIKEANELK